MIPHARFVAAFLFVAILCFIVPSPSSSAFEGGDEKKNVKSEPLEAPEPLREQDLLIGGAGNPQPGRSPGRAPSGTPDSGSAADPGNALARAEGTLEPRPKKLPLWVDWFLRVGVVVLFAWFAWVVLEYYGCSWTLTCMAWMNKRKIQKAREFLKSLADDPQKVEILKEHGLAIEDFSPIEQDCKPARLRFLSKAEKLLKALTHQETPPTIGKTLDARGG